MIDLRILGLDYGSKTLGVAISDPFGWTAQGVETITRKEETNLVQTVSRLKEIIEGYNVDKIILGLPKNMNNTEGERVEKTMIFKRRLEREFNLPIETWDERLSTMAAERLLVEADVHKKNHKRVIDKIAAMYILQGYLDAQR